MIVRGAKVRGVNVVREFHRGQLSGGAVIQGGIFSNT